MEDDKMTTCTMCGAQFKTKEELDKHNAEAHPDM